MSKHKNGVYGVIDTLDLRAFDNRKKDCGVQDYLNCLGFIPDVISLLECSVEQIHSNNGIIDSSTIPYFWVSERELPGGNEWNKRQLYNLVEAVHAAGSKFYMGTLASVNNHGEYFKRAEWLYSHADEYDIFAVDRNGKVFREDVGLLNPLRRLPDGRLYEDVFVEDLIKYLNDYNMDGYFAGDGWCGLAMMLCDGDFHDDMIRQFEEWSGIKVPGTTAQEYAEFLWDTVENRHYWIDFYRYRWAAFYKKISSRLKETGKELAALDPWARGSVDAVFDYGIDYKMLAEAGLKTVSIQAREENWGHRGGEWLYVWEAGEIANLASIKAHAPEMEVYWAVATCNAPEHWIATKDTPNILERQSLSLPTVTYIDKSGEYKRVLDGVLFIFGTDLDNHDWNFLSERWQLGFGETIKRTRGPALLFSDSVYEWHIKNGLRWEFTAPTIKLITAGVPVHSAVNVKNLKNASAEGYIILNPMGINDEEAELIIQKRQEGANIVMIGRTDNKKLLKEFGLSEIAPCTQFELLGTPALCDYRISNRQFDLVKMQDDDFSYVASDEAVILAEYKADTAKSVAAAVIRGQDKSGTLIYIGRLHKWPQKLRRWNFKFTMKTFVEQLPDDTDMIYAELINGICVNKLHVTEGQYFMFETDDHGTTHIGVGNMGNMFYAKPMLVSNQRIMFYDDYPIQRYTPGGYIHYDTTDKTIKIEVPPDGSVQIRVRFEK